MKQVFALNPKKGPYATHKKTHTHEIHFVLNPTKSVFIQQTTLTHMK